MIKVHFYLAFICIKFIVVVFFYIILLYK